MLLPTVNDLIFPRMLMCASLKLAKPAPHSLVLARMEACVVIVMTMIELNAWCDTCGGCYQLHKSTTSSSASFDDQLTLGPNTKTMMFESNTTYRPKHCSFQWNLAYILKYGALISIP